MAFERAEGKRGTITQDTPPNSLNQRTPPKVMIWHFIISAYTMGHVQKMAKWTSDFNFTTASIRPKETQTNNAGDLN